MREGGREDRVMKEKNGARNEPTFTVMTSPLAHSDTYLSPAGCLLHLCATSESPGSPSGTGTAEQSHS